ncbi:hypothetical protein [Pseudomonas sp. GOM6]|uniref:ParB/RepB/Spo0J family partition protein n=1 Tax=Pseudomonas sp. GOM6 TaxID=3036944 RepID=UPI0024090C8A|nr:hypothetical protein [Pseudomonas sp. GOM6]MDG1581079.1 hypothetical protein [Pseudomonas sp. GOM6]
MTIQAAELTLTTEAIPSDDFSEDLFFGGIKKFMGKTPSADLWKIEAKDLETLQILPGLNVRIDDEGLKAHIRQLADSMKVGGYKMSKPIEVAILDRNGELGAYITDGHCRIAAVKLAISEGAEIKQISCVTLPSKGMDIKDLTVGLIRSNSGKDLTPYEKAIACKRLFNYGMSEAEIAEKTGITPEYVGLLLEAISAPLSIVAMIQAGEVALNTAVETMRKYGPKAVEMLKAGLVASKAAGKKSVTASFLPGASLAKHVKRQAEPLYDAAKAVSSDPAFSQLGAETQALIKDLLKTIADKEAASQKKAASQVQAETEGQDPAAE